MKKRKTIGAFCHLSAAAAMGGTSRPHASSTAMWIRPWIRLLPGPPSESDPDYMVTNLNADTFVRKTIDSGKAETFHRFHGKALGDTSGGT